MPVVPAVPRRLADYQKHVELYGSECVLEAAGKDLTRKDLCELVAVIAHVERVTVFRGGVWVHRGGEVRLCLECGKELPATASPLLLRHPHCKERAKKRRQRKRRSRDSDQSGEGSDPR